MSDEKVISQDDIEKLLSQPAAQAAQMPGSQTLRRNPHLKFRRSGCNKRLCLC